MTNETIGCRIRNLRKKMNMTQKQFAEKIGITQAHLSGVENSKDNPSDSILRIICNEFGVRMRWLKSGEGNQTETIMSREEYIKRLPPENRPEPNETTLNYVLNHPIPKVKEEFFALVNLYADIISTCEMVNGFDFLAIDALGQILNAVEICFCSCNSQVKTMPPKISKEHFFKILGMISENIMNCRNEIVEDLNLYQESMRDRIFIHIDE